MYSNVRSSRSRRKLKWYSKIIVILIPLVIFSISINATTRVADAYNWKMVKVQEQAASEKPGDAQVLSAMGIYVDTGVLSHEISDFMKHKAKEIVTLDKENEYYDFYLPTKADFSENDYRLLKKVRIIDDILLALAVLSAIWVFLISFFHVREGYETKKQLRKLYLISLAVQLAGQCIVFAFMMQPSLKNLFMSRILGVTFAEGDLVPGLFLNGLAPVIAVAQLGLTAAVTLIIFYIVWICTKPRDIFNERRYFR